MKFVISANDGEVRLFKERSISLSRNRTRDYQSLRHHNASYSLSPTSTSPLKECSKATLVKSHRYRIAIDRGFFFAFLFQHGYATKEASSSCFLACRQVVGSNGYIQLWVSFVCKITNSFVPFSVDFAGLLVCASLLLQRM